jgi:formyl-CoA transferase
METGALSGLKVLDVATLYPAPLLAALLGDFGADVVKVEPRDGDPLRAYGPVPWALAGRNKRSVRIDFDTDAGLSLLHQLVGVADVVVLNQPASLLQRWECSDAQIADRNSRAVIVHVSAFGSTGPYADRVGNGTLAEAFAGIPMSSVPLGDSLGAMAGFAGVLTALYSRDARGGGGQIVDVSLYESLLPLLAPAIAGLSSANSLRELFTASDGRTVAISATTDPQRQRLRELAGTDVAGWVEARSASESVDALVAARVPAVEANDLAHLLADPHVVARESITSVDGTTVPSPSPKLSATPGRITHLGPELGEHTQEVVAEWLHGGHEGTA